MKILGIDIGATNTKFVVLENFKRILKKEFSPTPKKKREFFLFLRRKIKEIIEKEKISKIGIGIAGILDQERKKIIFVPNLKFLSRTPLKKIIEKEFKKKIKLENDTNCFTLSEAFFGRAKKNKIIVGLTLGTGIGGCILFKKKIYKGAFGAAGEIGHMVINFERAKCSCRNLGCFEAFGSERFFKRKKVFSKDIEQKARKGDRNAKRIFEEYGRYLGIGISNIINILDPEIIVLGGGEAKAFDLFFPSLKKEIEKRVISPFSRKFVKIKKGKFLDFGGAIGACALFKLN